MSAGKNTLIGWDDGNIYFHDHKGIEYCVNEEDKLLRELIKKCKDYYKDLSTSSKTKNLTCGPHL